MAKIAVVGGGALGCLAALNAARAGHDVTILERRERLWSGASAANEGKIHLGHVFALADRATREVMLRGALTFADLVEAAVGPVDWARITTAPFRYVVMPGSLLDVDSLAAHYARLQADFEVLAPRIGRRYLGSELRELTQRDLGTHAPSGLPTFTTSEVSVDPTALGALVVAAVEAAEPIAVTPGADVSSLESTSESVIVHYRRAGESPAELRADAVLNCAWESQQVLRGAHHALNYRTKTAVLVPEAVADGPLTLVQGPFGDVVPLPGRSYLSWYPVARLTHELSVEPSSASRAALAETLARGRTAQQQLDALAEFGLVAPISARDATVVGGFIVGEGPLDIDDVASHLHRRGDFGTDVEGRVLTPRNYKLTTAPLAARLACDRLDELLT